MEIELNHFKTRAVFDRISKQYQDISFIQDTEQVHTHDHIYQFVTPDMKGKLDTIRKITYQEFRDLQQPLEDGFYLYDDLGIFVVHTNNNVSGVSDSYLYMITTSGVEIYKWVSNRYGNVGNIGELEITSDSETATISSTISATDTSEVEIPSATTTTAGLLSASDKIKINNTVLTCTGQEADDISMFENDSNNGESFMRYCPERNIFYYFSSNYRPTLSPEREYYRVQLGFDNETGFAAYIEKFQNNQWVDVGRLGEINQEFVRTNNSMLLTQNYASENNIVTIPNVTSELAGIMTAADKVKLDNIREFTEEKEEVIAHSLNDLNSRVTELSENNTNLNEDIEKTERVISESLNDLNSRINELTENNTDLNSRLDELNEIIEENELITASALNDLDLRTGTGNNSEIALRFISTEEDTGDAIQSFSNLNAINKEFIDKLHQVQSGDELEIRIIKLKSIVGQNSINHVNYYPNVTVYQSVNNRGINNPDKIFIININISMPPSGNNETINIQFILEGSDHTLMIQYVDVNGSGGQVIYDFGAVSTDTNGIEYYELTKHNDN